MKHALISHGSPRGLTLHGACIGGLLVLFAFLVQAEEVLPDPGPENGGMRLRLVVRPERLTTNEVYHVRLDLLNVTEKPITLVADWSDDSQRGDYKEYLEADVSIETYPEIIGLMAQVSAGQRRTPQPQCVLEANKTLTLEWTSGGKRLKNKWTHLLETQNPAFPADGLYSVHASVKLCVASPAQVGSAGASEIESRGKLSAEEGNGSDAREVFKGTFDSSNPHGTIFLRSNEQQVPIGGSQQLPKFHLGRIVGADNNIDTATIDLGSWQKIEVGDRFKIWSGLIAYTWEMTVTNVGLTSAVGHFEMMKSPVSTNSVFGQIVPKPGMIVELRPSH
jgi:hypothetical protein